MIQDKPSSKKKVVLLAVRLLLILGLWLGGTYAFEALNNLRAVPHAVATDVQADGAINVWWPTNNSKISGLQPFKAIVQDKNVGDYTMYWSVDGGQPNQMGDSSTDYPHKEASVDLSSWNWKGAGPYKVTFRALDKSGNSLGETSIDLYRPDATQGVTTVVAGTSQTQTVAPQQSVVSSVVSAITQSGVKGASADTISSPQATVAPVTAAVTSAPATVTSAPAVTASVAAAPAPSFLSVWVPGTNSHISGLTAFKAAVDGMNTSDYTMVWQVDGGNRNDMYTSGTGGPHKEADVNVSSWTWRGNGPYKVKFTAEKNGQQIATSEVTIYTNDVAQTQNNPQDTSKNKVQDNSQTVQITNVAPEVLAKSTTQTQTLVSAPEVLATPLMASSGNPLSGLKFFVNPYSNAKRQADAWRSSRPTDAALMDKIANSPEATWLGGWSGDVASAVSSKVAAAKSQGSVPVFIAYNIPNRDCGQYSAGGVSDASSYANWISGIARGLGGAKAVVVLEPDALALNSCLSAQQKTDRNNMITNAVSTLKGAGAVVYLDAGHPGWVSADDMASRLKASGVDKADGFALNVSNFIATSDNINYGTQISGKIGGKHFVIDTARNGQGAAGSEWCNPQGRGLGVRSTANTGNGLVDGFLWLKNPGESDGNCNGGPGAGTWWPEYALGLAQRAAF